MKNNQAWVIIGVVLIVAIGAIWYMTHKVTEVPSDEVTAIVPAQGTVKGGTQTTATKGTTALLLHPARLLQSLRSRV
jgi:hypothetical protein